MDGNRRWAREQKAPTLEGHRVGLLQTFVDCVRWVQEAGVEHLVVYAFSTENWKRTQEEVSYLMDLFGEMFGAKIEDLSKENVRVRFIGDREMFSEKLQQIMRESEEKTSHNDGVTVWVCVSYGGRLEITQAARVLVEKGESVTENSLREAMWSKGMPDPDLVIRTGGERRLSNFLLWQAAYSELFFTDTYWPAFTKEELHAILKEYAERERRFGK